MNVTGKMIFFLPLQIFNFSNGDTKGEAEKLRKARLNSIKKPSAWQRKPLWGWGIGSWNDQWRMRVPQELAEFNMPHNDALWMGAQAGILGAFLWMSLMMSHVNSSWKIRNAWGASACAAIFMATFSSLVNNGTRDATIGLPMLWMVGVLISLARASTEEKVAV